VERRLSNRRNNVTFLANVLGKGSINVGDAAIVKQNSGMSLLP